MLAISDKVEVRDNNLNNIQKNNILWRHKPLHLSEDERQLGSHIKFVAKLPAKWQVTHDNIYPSVRQRYHCIHRTHTERSEVTKHTVGILLARL